MAAPQILHSEVSLIMDVLRKSGQIPTVDSVAQALNCPDSRLLILKLMAEVIAAEAALHQLGGELTAPRLQLVANDLPSYQNPSSEDYLKATLNVVVADSEQILGCSKAFFEKMEQLEADRSKLIAELKVCRAQLAKFTPQAIVSPHSRPVNTGPEEIFGL